MAKRKRGLAAYKRAKKNNSVVSRKSNPPPLKDLAEFVVPGFAGYAGTRMVSRIVHGMIIRRYPRLAKHASVISTGLAAAAAWFLVHRIKSVKQYHTPVVVGAGIAALQTAVQAYLPKYGWMVSDHNLNAQTPAQAALPPSQAAQLNAGNQAATNYTTQTPAPATVSQPIAVLSNEEVASELDELDMGSLTSGLDADDGGGGISDYEMDMLADEANDKMN